MSASRIQRQQELWKKYQETKDQSIKEQLILEYADLVKYVAGRLSIYFGSNVEYDDLVGYGVFGLIDAIDKFDIYKGVKFETYASLRIRGAIIDSIRELDWVPRSLRKKAKILKGLIRSWKMSSDTLLLMNKSQEGWVFLSKNLTRPSGK